MMSVTRLLSEDHVIPWAPTECSLPLHFRARRCALLSYLRPMCGAARAGHSDQVIHEVDVALRSLIEREATDGTEVEVVFDAPTKDWAGRRNVPTIDVYLYDIREDLRRRERGLINEYDDRDRISGRRLPPRHFKLSYLVTAWTQRPEDEHRLLSALLSCFLRHDAIPPDLVTGPLAELGLPVPVTVALPPPEDRSFADVWSALGGELKPSLDVVVSAPTDTGQQYHAGPPVVDPAQISLGGVGGWPPRETREQSNGGSGGRSHDGAPGARGGPVGDRRPGGTGAGGGHTGGSAAASTRQGSTTQGSTGQGSGSSGPGMSWSELARSGGAARADAAKPTGPDAEDPQTGPTPDGAAPDSRTSDEKPAAAQRPKPPARRRRQGGISQRE